MTSPDRNISKRKRRFQATASFTVLVASSDSSFVSEVAGYLQPFGYAVATASDSMTALEMVRRDRPDLILAEVELPPLTGFELAQAVKQDPALRVIPFLLVADSYFDTEAKVKGLAMGADDLLYRPLHEQELRARIRSSLRVKAYVQQILEDRGRLEELVRERTAEIEQFTLGLVAALERANRMNDTDTGSHIRRVSAYSKLVAQGLGLEPQLVSKIERYASLHDVGKVGLPDAILKKEDILTEEEALQVERRIDGLVSDCMTPEAYAIEPTWTVGTAARFMVEKKTQRLFVTDRKEVRGVVSTMDLLRLLANGDDE